MSIKSRIIRELKQTRMNKYRNELKVKMRPTAEQKELQETKDKKNEEIRDINEFCLNWIRVMAFLGLDNKLDQTYSLTFVKKTSYGYKCNINIATGLSLATLESETIVKAIESNLGCKFITKSTPMAQHLEADFIKIKIPEVIYKPYVDEKGKKLKPYEIMLGIGIDGKPIIISMLDYPHCIIQGAPGMGKTKCIDTITTNLIVSNTPEDLALYIIQADKSDQIIYRRDIHTRAYAKDVNKALAITNYLKAIVEARDKILQPLTEDGICENIQNFNKVYKKYKQNKFSYIYLIIDEYSSLMPESKDKDKDVKTEIQENMKRLSAIGRYVGVYILIGIQKTTIEQLPSFLKSNMNTVITFRVNNVKTSEVAIDCHDAVKLLPREFIVKTSGNVYGKTTTIYPSTILENILPFRRSEAQYQDFNYTEWYDPNAPTEKEKKKQQNKESKNKKRQEARYGNNDSKITQSELERIKNENNGRV